MRHKTYMQRATIASVYFFLLAFAACKKAPTADTVNQTSPNNNSSTFSVAGMKQQRLAWNLRTIVQAYEHAGYTNPKWDASAKLALTEFARTRSKVTDTNESWAEIISTNVAAAIQSGCNDPMVNYLSIRYSLDQTNSKETFTSAYFTMEKEMQKSSYPAIRKFYATFRTINQFTYANEYPTNWPREIFALNREMGNDLSAVLDDKTTPSVEIYDACHEFLSMWEGSTNKKDYETYYNCTEPAFFKNWPNDPYAWLLKGEAYIHLAWNARGNSTADKVTDEGGKLFKERLAVAENALTNAWSLNPTESRIPVQMLTVELGQGQGRDRLDLWFNRAMELDPDNYTACHAKLYYLEPKWYGSTEDMLKFGRECVQNKKWGGRVPLILVAAHDFIGQCIECLDKTEQADYWKRPEVWNDIQAAYDRFFEVNPDATSYYHNYALYAYRAEQWNKLNELIPKLGPINYDFFGGKNEFDKIVQLAKENASKPK